MFVQQIYPLVSLKPLHGDFVAAESAEFNFKDWFDGEYQTKTNGFLNENFGFRNFLLRIHNQLNFSLFKTTTAKEVVIGKQNYLYVQGYINAYHGTDFLGDGSISDTIAKLKTLQEKLKGLGKTLLVVLAPSKARIYPEYIPERFSTKKTSNSNYASYAKGFDRSGINYIDFNNLFLKKKETSPYLLIPQLGVHWSHLEAVRAFDTIQKQLSYLAAVQQPRIKITEVKEAEELIDPDNDVIEGMNVLTYPDHKKMAYPTFEYVDLDKPRYSALTISDSYWWDIYLSWIPRNIFKSNSFGYYFTELWSSNFLGKKQVEAIDLKRHLLQQDFVIIICSESNLERFGFGFIGAAISALDRNISPTNEELDDISTGIRANPEWMSQIQNRISKNGASLEAAIREDANWIFQQHGPALKEITLNDMKTHIREDENWMKKINAQAVENEISVDSMITAEAVWVMDADAEKIVKGVKNTRLNEVKEYIKNDKAWMQQINEKSLARKISIDSMIVLDALWTIEQEKIKKN